MGGLRGGEHSQGKGNDAVNRKAAVLNNCLVMLVMYSVTVTVLACREQYALLT